MLNRPINKARQDLIAQYLKLPGVRSNIWLRESQIVREEQPADQDGLLWTLTTDMPAIVFDWDRYDFVYEVLVMEGMMVPAIGQVPLLDSHNRWSCDDVLGHVQDFADAERGKYAAKDGMVFFAADEKSQRTRQKVVDRHLLDGSVGYQVLKSVWIPNGEEAAVAGTIYQGPLKVSYSWLLKEFSVTPVGADVLAKVRALRGAGRG